MTSCRRTRAPQCLYCGAREGSTRDHVPPRNLFTKPLPDNLITVPACRSCNKGFDLDDEYFRQVITLGVDPKRFPIAISAIRNLGGPKKRGFLRKMLSDLSPEKQWMNVERERVDRVTRRIIRGLFFHHTKLPLPQSAEVRVWFPCFGETLAVGDEFLALTRILDRQTPHSVGAGVFAYRYFVDSESPDYSLWRLCFYEKNELIGMSGTT